VRFWAILNVDSTNVWQHFKRTGKLFYKPLIFSAAVKVCYKTALFGRKVIQVLGNFGRLFNKCLAAVVLF
jgi:hypothetical protein